MISLLRRWLFPELSTAPHPVDWLFEPDEDDDETSALGFNEPTSYEPGNDEEDE